MLRGREGLTERGHEEPEEPDQEEEPMVFLRLEIYFLWDTAWEWHCCGALLD